ncbi:hypothetical protein N7U66_17875 [Lacinutrix neustonica]|uniref:Uncharacterized protein n=1 Tax=Lacinutrix neustonica TaxID=2980107 RepID=A0A9E8SCV4_9FLAO|nr:hypothetical protein [Lacinutrix neustonica]WAC01743.1 hypothetical protein N7U66_17875 [Lacinutrix neustonica]
MKNFSQIFLVFVVVFAIHTTHAQVGINTDSPHASSILDIESSNKGVLLPRMTTLEIGAIPNPANGLLIYNIDTNNFIYNTGSSIVPAWSSINKNVTVSTDSDNQITTGTDGGAYLNRGIHMGKFTIYGTGTLNVSGLPFEPSQIKFTAYANVETYNLNSDNGLGNNNNTIANAFGSMSGYATNYSSALSQQVIYVGGSGRSINDISEICF